MASLDEQEPSEFVKLILIGNSGAGKTGALTSLVKAGYNLRIIDLDAGLEALSFQIKEECPERLRQVQYQSFRDKMKMGGAGPVLVGAPKAYVNTLNALEKWPDDKSDPAEWGKDTILVIDSLTNLGRAAFQWARAMNMTSKDPRQWYKAGQDLIEDLIANITSKDFRTNVIVISHIEYVESSGITKGYVSALGKALGPKIPRFFNTLVLSETSGSGKTVKRQIKTFPTGAIDLKNPAPTKFEAAYDISDGLARIFATLKSQN